MRVIALAVAFFLAAFVYAQDATPSPPLPEDAPAEATGRQSPALERPFLQSDLELMSGNVQRPNGFVWFDGSLYTVCNGDWTIYRIDDRSGETETFVFGVRDGSSLLAEATEAGFDLIVPDPDSGNLWKVDQRREAPVSIAAELTAPWGIARLNEAAFLLSDTRRNAILEAPIAGEPVAVIEGLRAPTGIVRHDERVYFGNGGSARRGIEYATLDEDGRFSDVKPLVSGIQNTTDLALGADGNLYFAYALGTRGVVGRVDPTRCLEGGCGNQDVETVVLSDLPAPLAITLSDDMRLFLHSRYRPEFYWAQLPT